MTAGVEFDLTSFTFSVDGRLSAAGPATRVFGSPKFGPDSLDPFFHTVEVGETLFFSVLDNSGTGIPDAFIEGKVPIQPWLDELPFPALVEDFRTIQEILAFIGLAPDFIFRQVENGNLVIH